MTHSHVHFAPAPLVLATRVPANPANPVRGAVAAAAAAAGVAAAGEAAAAGAAGDPEETGGGSLEPLEAVDPLLAEPVDDLRKSNAPAPLEDEVAAAAPKTEEDAADVVEEPGAAALAPNPLKEEKMLGAPSCKGKMKIWSRVNGKDCSTVFADLSVRELPLCPLDDPALELVGRGLREGARLLRLLLLVPVVVVQHGGGGALGGHGDQQGSGGQDGHDVVDAEEDVAEVQGRRDHGVRALVGIGVGALLSFPHSDGGRTHWKQLTSRNRRNRTGWQYSESLVPW